MADESSQQSNRTNAAAEALHVTAHRSNVIADVRAEEQALPPEFELPHDNPEQ
ncbi:hypothetical protein RAC89_17475 [Paenibacillus sp. GD4]|uniref:hypothetical protein n=1 Tax=Paenibacillus sp. GD4 TaxID=3068890 RepID=UPI0027969E5A|nr:hypothetical protein [Paenibacillus sp. GD4]MDQ1912180.1 hypothetical protein [Paenibacillus sp. GD4]